MLVNALEVVVTMLFVGRTAVDFKAYQRHFLLAHVGILVKKLIYYVAKQRQTGKKWNFVAPQLRILRQIQYTDGREMQISSHTLHILCRNSANAAEHAQLAHPRHP